VTPLHVTKFAERVRAMNAGNAKELKLTAAEARGLHSDLFTMLEEIAELRDNPPSEEVIEIKLDAGDNSL
jgi:hypothetical protein